VRRLELLVGGLFWWHPVVWWARHALRETEELACDAWVVWALPKAAVAYATALVETVAFLSQARSAPLLAASGIGHVRTLKRRLTMIVRGTPPRALSAAGFLIVLALGALLLPLLPTRAEQGAAEEPKSRPPVAGNERTATSQETVAPSRDPRASSANPAQDTSGPKGAGPKTEGPKEDASPKGSGPIGAAPKTSAARTAVPEESTAEQIEKATEDIELLEAQLEAKKAEVEEAQALLKQATVEVSRLDKILKHSATGVSEGEYQTARSKVEIARARVKGKEALMVEVSIRLKHAERRLARLKSRVTGRKHKEAEPFEDETPKASSAPTKKPNRFDELEKKLDALQKALDKIDQKLRRPKPSDTPKKPTP
jgi:hypothetical protein